MGTQESVNSKLICGAHASVDWKFKKSEIWEKNYEKIMKKTKNFNINTAQKEKKNNHISKSFISGNKIHQQHSKSHSITKCNKQNFSDKKPFSNKKKSKIKKYNLNILYYDEHLNDNEENSDNCSFIEMNTNGTFYGCHNFELFKIVCEKIVKSKKEFILLSSGSSAQKIYDYCLNMKEIREYYILFSKREIYTFDG